jgi:anti-sigma factor RsiW
MTHITDEQLVAYALDDVEAGTRATVETHFEACAACRASLAEIRATLDQAAALHVPDRGDDYGATVWRSIESRLDESRVNEGSHVSTPALRHSTLAHRHSGTSARLAVRLAPWLAAAAALLLAVGAYWLGRHNAGIGSVPPAPVSEQASLGTEAIRERVVLAALGEHFDRTERTLVELVNSQPGRRVDISAEQAWARDLLEANRLYRQAAGGHSPALSQVLEDLEPVLLEIANSPSQLTSDEFETLRDRIEARSLVFKVRVTGADVRARERALIRRGELQS